MDTATYASAIKSDASMKQQTEEYLKGIFARSTTDAAFRQKLLTDSAAAMAEFGGVSVDSLPAARINFVQHADAPTVVLPKFGQDLEELSDNQLETVSGGTDPFTLGALFVYGVVVGVEVGVIVYEAAKAYGASQQ